MDTEHIKEPEDGLIKFGPEVVADIRKEFNMDNKENREQAIAIIQEWIKQQDHFVKKNFSKGYIERCIILSRGSIGIAKAQIDRLCTMRTLVPKFFSISNSNDSEIMEYFDRSCLAMMPKLTKEYYRVVIIRPNPNSVITSSHQFTMFFKLLILVGEYLMSHEYNRGFIFIADYSDVNLLEYLYKLNLVDLQQFVPILTTAYRCKLKGVYTVTSSKLIEGFLSMVKPLISAKIASRIHVVKKRSDIAELLNCDCVPVEYGGTERPLEELSGNLFKTLTSEPIRELVEEMKKAVTDETKRRRDTFNDQYMGMSGTFRTLSLD